MTISKNLILVSILIFYSLSSVYSSCVEVNPSMKVCYSNCLVNSLCQLYFQTNQSAILVPTNSQYFILTNNFVKFGKLYGVSLDKNNNSIEIVPTKEKVSLSSIILNHRLYSATLTFSSTPALHSLPTSSTTSISEKNTKKHHNSNIIIFNILYLFFVLILILVLSYSQMRIEKLEKKHKNEIENIIKEIESKADSRNPKEQSVQPESSNSQDVELRFENKPLDESELTFKENANSVNFNNSALSNAIPALNRENEIIKKVIITSKMKGIPREVLYNHLVQHYNEKKVNEFMRRYY